MPDLPLDLVARVATTLGAKRRALVAELLAEVGDEVVDPIVNRIDDMVNRIDDLEKSISELIAEAGVEEASLPPDQASSSNPDFQSTPSREKAWPCDLWKKAW